MMCVDLSSEMVTTLASTPALSSTMMSETLVLVVWLGGLVCVVGRGYWGACGGGGNGVMDGGGEVTKFIGLSRAWCISLLDSKEGGVFSKEIAQLRKGGVLGLRLIRVLGWLVRVRKGYDQYLALNRGLDGVFITRQIVAWLWVGFVVWFTYLVFDFGLILL